jgi:ATP-dependent helicase/nuclease subunit A
LAWTIYEEDNERLAGPIASVTPAGSTEPSEAPDPAILESLRQKLEWRYPFVAATTEPAKTSVSALRRRMREETDAEANPLFRASSDKPRARSRLHGVAGKLSAAEVGTAHHLFLQLVSLTRVGTRPELVSEAERMSRAAILSEAELAALDFDALLAFWQSELGGRIRVQTDRHIHRELPFTARMSRADLEALNLGVNAGLPADEFVVVQGFADLAVILPEAIWLVDFKTDHVEGGKLETVAKFYEPQLRLYALALGRIYRRPVTESWLHFLSLKKSVAVAP